MLVHIKDMSASCAGTFPGLDARMTRAAKEVTALLPKGSGTVDVWTPSFDVAHGVPGSPGQGELIVSYDRQEFDVSEDGTVFHIRADGPYRVGESRRREIMGKISPYARRTLVAIATGKSQLPFLGVPGQSGYIVLLPAYGRWRPLK